MPVLSFCKSLFLFTIFSAAFQCSLQDTLSCGATSFQVSFEPSRPQFGGGSSNIGIGSSAKYTFQQLETILKNGQQVCNLSMSSTVQPLMFDPQQQIMRQQSPAAPPPLSNTRVTLSGTSHDDNSRSGGLVITKCENCSNCPQELPLIHRVLSRLAIENGLQSLLVIVGHKESDHVKVVENTIAKFVYMSVDEDPGPLTICELTDTADNDALKSFSKTSVLFVSISFIILMVISLAWLVFYYVQRFRYAHAKDRLQRRLFNAAKKALTRIPTRPVKAGDKELDSDCPVCIDPYRTGDIVRMLPCRHIFHKSCVDPWLLEHRTCPMCKSDILKAFGYHVSVNSRRRAQFSSQMGEDSEGGRRVQSGHHRHNNDTDRMSVDANSTTSESNAFPFPVVSEIHDPFSFTPSTSPQLVQVMHATNARSFSIIPLTVHSGVGGQYAQSSSSATQTAVDGISNPGYGATLINASIERHNQTGHLSMVKENSKPQSPSSGGHLLRAMTSGSRRPLSKGHVVNLVHVRSRSLSHAQLPLNAGTSSSTGSISSKNNNGGLVTCEAVPIEYHSIGEGPEGKALRPTALFRSANIPNEELNSAELEEEFPFVLRTKASQYSAQAEKRPTTGSEGSPPPTSETSAIFSQVDQELMAQAHMPNYVPVSPSICLDGSRQQTPSQMSQFSNTSPNPRQLVRGHSARANRTSTAPTRCKGVMQGRDKKPPSYASFHYALPPSTEGPPTVGSSVGEKELIESIGQALPPSGLNPLELKSKQKQRAVPSFPQPHFDTISVESL